MPDGTQMRRPFLCEDPYVEIEVPTNISETGFVRVHKSLVVDESTYKFSPADLEWLLYGKDQRSIQAELNEDLLRAKIADALQMHFCIEFVSSDNLVGHRLIWRKIFEDVFGHGPVDPEGMQPVEHRGVTVHPPPPGSHDPKWDILFKYCTTDGQMRPKPPQNP